MVGQHLRANGSPDTWILEPPTRPFGTFSVTTSIAARTCRANVKDWPKFVIRHHNL